MTPTTYLIYHYKFILHVLTNTWTYNHLNISCCISYTAFCYIYKNKNIHYSMLLIIWRRIVILTYHFDHDLILLVLSYKRVLMACPWELRNLSVITRHTKHSHKTPWSPSFTQWWYWLLLAYVFCLPPMALRCFGSLPICNVVSASNPGGFTMEGSQRNRARKFL